MTARLSRSALRLATLLALVLPGPGLAAGTGGDRGGNENPPPAPQGGEQLDEADLLYREGMELVKAGQLEEAREKFEKAHKNRKKDPEILNMLAYTQRKTGNLDDAFENYHKALGIRPNFPEAREYLGEAHIQAALLQIEILRGYGAAGEKSLGELVAALQAAAKTLTPEAMDASARGEARGDW